MASPTSNSHAALCVCIKFEILQACKQATKLLGRYIENRIKYHSLPIGVRTKIECQAYNELQFVYNADKDGDLPVYIDALLLNVHHPLCKAADALKAGNAEEAEQKLYIAEEALDDFREIVGFSSPVSSTLWPRAMLTLREERWLGLTHWQVPGLTFRDWSWALMAFSEGLPKNEL